MIQDYYLNNGNPNVYDVLSNINDLTSIYMTTTYNRITNKFTYTRTYPQTTNYYNMDVIQVLLPAWRALKKNSFSPFDTQVPSQRTLVLNIVNSFKTDD